MREYIARGFTDNVHACASLITATTRAQFVSLLEEYDRQMLSFRREQKGAHKSEHGFGTRRCDKCNKEGHISKFCDEDSGDQEGSSYPQSSSQQWHKSQDRPKPKSLDLRYFMCIEMTHIALSCP